MRANGVNNKFCREDKIIQRGPNISRNSGHFFGVQIYCDNSFRVHRLLKV